MTFSAARFLSYTANGIRRSEAWANAIDFGIAEYIVKSKFSFDRL